MSVENADELPYILPENPFLGRIGVVTVTFNSEAVLPDFMESTARQTHRDFIVYVIDNNSSDQTLSLVRAWKDPRLVVIPNSVNRGVAAGNNQGIRAAIEAGCKYILLLNNDVVFGNELFEQLLQGLVDERCDMTVPLIYFNDRADVIWCAGGHFQPRLGYRSLHYGEGQRDIGQFGQARAVSYSPTCCVLIDREVFGRIGLMDERYFVYGDDVDFMLRALKARKTLFYLPNAKLWHKVNSLTGSKSPFTLRYGTRSRAFFIAKHVARLYAVLFNGLYPIYFLLRFLFGQDNWQDARIRLAAWNEGKQILARSVFARQSDLTAP